ncbi:thioredoxin family protein [uncultured Clostridium sp.]|uniref:thioredoxin family protein n=1 Tax=uncultured Clostridium sp. TaxID=59620 RepID=UPI0026256CB6|nr:thioredoxin family protein [uncultured Clostridium sp.]
MIDINTGLTYNEYLNLATDEDRDMIEEFYAKSPIHTSSIPTLKDNHDIIVFSMPRCRDAATVIPVLLELSKHNPNINIKFFNKEGHEELLKTLTGDIKIPTILKLNSSGKILNKFLEFPSNVNEKICSNPDAKESIVANFRNNIYFKETKAEILDLLTK